MPLSFTDQELLVLAVPTKPVIFMSPLDVIISTDGAHNAAVPLNVDNFDVSEYDIPTLPYPKSNIDKFQFSNSQVVE